MISNRKSPSSASPRRPYKPKKDTSVQKSGSLSRDKSKTRKETKQSQKSASRGSGFNVKSMRSERKLKEKKASDNFQSKRKTRSTSGQSKKADPKQTKKKLLITVFSVIGIVLVGLISYIILSYTSTFKIEHIQIEPTEHISQEEVDKIVVVDPNATLLNVDTTEVVSELKKNPWVESVEVHRQFPDTLQVSITERKIYALALIGSENAAWFIGEDFHWIEPARVETEKNEAIREAALQLAKDNGFYLIYDLPSDINPESGAAVEVPVLLDVQKISKDLSSDLTSQILAFSAPARDSISLRLVNGIEIAFGSSEDIAAKEKVINAILQQHENQVTYINVRNPSKPTYRKIDV